MSDKTKRVYGRVDEETYAYIEKKIKAKGISFTDYISSALELKVKYDRGELSPPLETQRVNQLIDLIITLSSNVSQLENVVLLGFDSLLGLTRGDNYLLEDEDE